MNKSKKLLIATMVGISCVIMCPNKAKAALQANGGEPASYNPNSWVTGVRQMQATGQAMGLTDEIDATKLTSTNTNLDIHMEKNTEYGAMVLLSASAYGKPDKVNNGETTTGNKTGVVMKINQEWVAAVPSNTVTSMKNAVGRYKNVYPGITADSQNVVYKEKEGDAIATVGAWYEANGNTWLGGYYHYPNTNVGETARACLIRSYSGSIFSYYGNAFNLYSSGNAILKSRNAADYTKVHPTRAVVVVGSGI